VLSRLWSERLQDSRHRGFVADSDERIVGVGLAGPDPNDDSVGHLSRLYVEPSQWGRGTGRALYDACMSRLEEQGFTSATLWVLERNERVRDWYARLGWKPTGERKAVFAPAGIDDIGYALTLG
jgi:ribosomal protein S18 acetylase RimI-like enzyme